MEGKTKIILLEQEEALEVVCFSLGALQNNDFYASSQKF